SPGASHGSPRRARWRWRGRVEPVTGSEADGYFRSRPRDSRIGAWASKQSRPLESRFALEKAVASFAARYAIGEVPRPPYGSGFRVQPLAIEFWQDRPFRLHERLKFERPDLLAPWAQSRLYP